MNIIAYDGIKRLIYLTLFITVSSITVAQSKKQSAIPTKKSLDELELIERPESKPYSPVILTIQQPINQAMLAEAAKTPQGIPQIKQEWKEEGQTKLNYLHRVASAFKNRYEEFLQLSPIRFSVAKAVYICESAWYDNPPSWEQFEKQIKIKVAQVRDIQKRSGLTSVMTI